MEPITLSLTPIEAAQLRALLGCCNGEALRGVEEKLDALPLPRLTLVLTAPGDVEATTTWRHAGKARLAINLHSGLKFVPE